MNSIPVEFWKSLTDEQWMTVLKTSSLDRRLCRRLWAMTGRADKAPDKLFVYINKADLMRTLMRDFPPAKAKH